jgi:hypothetical protein
MKQSDGGSLRQAHQAKVRLQGVTRIRKITEDTETRPSNSGGSLAWPGSEVARGQDIGRLLIELYIEMRGTKNHGSIFITTG